MKRTKEFPFHRARRISPGEQKSHRKAIEAFHGKKRPARVGRPPKSMNEKYVPISIRLHPAALAWLKKQARKKRAPYQTIINEIILREAA